MTDRAWICTLTWQRCRRAIVCATVLRGRTARVMYCELAERPVHEVRRCPRIPSPPPYHPHCRCGAWIVAGAVVVLMFGFGLICGHRVATAHARHARTEAAVCKATLHRAGRSMSRMLASVEEANAEARDLPGREVFTINGIDLEVVQ